MAESRDRERTVWFYRDNQRMNGANLKHSHYLEHVQRTDEECGEGVPGYIQLCFRARLNTYRPSLIINACTRDLKSQSCPTRHEPEGRT